MQYVIPINTVPASPRSPKRRKPSVKKKAKPVIENCALPDRDVDQIPHEVLLLCAQVRSELSKLEAHASRSQLFRATKALAKPGAARIFKQLRKKGDSITELAKRIGWSQERTLRLVAGQESLGYWEIPKVAAALKVDVSVLLVAYGYPKDTFESTEALVRAVMMEAERSYQKVH
jgi:lambda repressor-like predicted transcriptional regulator